MQLSVSIVAIAAFLSLLAAPAFATIDSAPPELRPLLNDYIDLSNERRFDELISLYVEEPELVQQGETLTRGLIVEMREIIKKWDRYDATFHMNRVESAGVEGETAVVEFVLTGKGRFWGYRYSKDFRKELELIRDGDEWRIARDVTY